MQEQHIYPIFDKTLTRNDRETLLKQKAKVIWFTGLSGSGKSTLAAGLEKVLYQKGHLCKLLDGDNIRTGINNNLGFTEADRLENIRRIAEVCKLFLNCGVITLAAFISPTNEIRKQAMSIIGEENFVEIFVNPPLDVCEQRDTKGLYEKARRGEIKNFTGISSPFEAPEKPTLNLDTSAYTVEESVAKIVEILLPKISI
jgi:adenylylsulfate kinase